MKPDSEWHGKRQNVSTENGFLSADTSVLCNRYENTMIRTDDVIKFFDRLAPGWDAGMVRNEEVITKILNTAEVSAGKDILDVGCGTGNLIPDYLKRNVSSVTAIDISPRMAEIAREKFDHPNVTVLCGDAEKMITEKLFDCIVVYNAFPHFADQEGLIRHLASLLKSGGILTVAHGMSREMINAHHQGTAHPVSQGLMPADNLAKIFESYTKVIAVISDDQMYQVAGRKGEQPRPTVNDLS